MEDVSIHELRLFFERFKPQRLGILDLIDLLDDVQVGGDRVSARDPALHCIHVAQNILKEDSSELVARTYKLHFSQLVIKDGDDVLRIVVWLNALRKIFGMLPPQMQWRISMMCRSFVVMSAGVLQNETYYHDVTGYYIIPAGEKILISDKRRAECWVTKKAFFDHRGSLIDIQSLMIHSLVGKPFSVPRK